MSNNSFKSPIAPNLNKVADLRAGDAVQLEGQEYPCTVAAVVSSGVVTVSFQVSGVQLPNATIPVVWSEFTRLPVYVGMKGVARAASTRLGGVSGLGSGLAPVGLVANLGALAFEPIGNTAWSAVDGNKHILIGGPNGLQVQDASGTSIGLFTSTGITLSSHGHTLTINSSGIMLDGKVFATHMHTGVQSGTSDTGPVA